MNKKDLIGSEYNMSYMDDFHPYKCINSVWRYQHRRRAKIVNDCLNKEDREVEVLLDAGCGKAPYTFLSLKKANQIFSFEYSKVELGKAIENIRMSSSKEDVDKICFSQVDLQAIPLPDESVDLIVCSEVLEHVPDSKLAMAELYRVLRKNGTMVFSMPNKYSYYWLIRKLFYDVRLAIKKLRRRGEYIKNYQYDWDLKRHWCFTYKDINRLARDQNFEVIREDGVHTFPLPIVFFRFVFKLKLLFFVFDSIDKYLSRKLPKFSAFYFLVLKK